MTQAIELLTITDDPAVQVQIADLIVATVKKTKKLPVPEEIRRKVRTGHDLDTTITTGQWLEQWLAGRKALRPSTRRTYEAHIRLYYLPNIGAIALDKLRVSDVDSVFEAIDEHNDTIAAARACGDPVLRAKVRGRRVVGAATKQRIRGTLRAALNKAIRERRIDLNVASLVELETGKRPKALVWTPERITEWHASRDRYIAVMAQRLSVLAHTGDTKYKTTRVKAINSYVGATRPSPVMVWTPEQTALFLDHIRGHRLYAQYHLIAFRGLRRGESCGLRWSDLNMREATVAVRWQIVQIGYEPEQGKPKSEAGERHPRRLARRPVKRPIAATESRRCHDRWGMSLTRREPDLGTGGFEVASG